MLAYVPSDSQIDNAALGEPVVFAPLVIQACGGTWNEGFRFWGNSLPFVCVSGGEVKRMHS